MSSDVSINDNQLSQLSNMIQENKIRKATLTQQGDKDKSFQKLESNERISIRNEEKSQQETKKDLYNIKEDLSDSEDENKQSKQNISKKANRNAHSNSRFDKSQSQKDAERAKNSNKRAYEFYRSNQTRKEDIFLGQKDQSKKLIDKQATIAKKVDEIQSKLKSIDIEMKNKKVSDSNVNYQDAYFTMQRENSELKKELQAIQLAKSVVASKNKDKKLQKSIGNETVATRDRKKVSDLLKLVDMLKKQLQESEDRMKTYQNLHKSVLAQSQFQASMANPEKSTAYFNGQREINAKMQGMAAKNDELVSNMSALKQQLKACKQENAQLLIELKQANDKIVSLGKENRSLQLCAESADEYQKQIIDLKKQRDNTELRLKELLSSPFFKDHGEKAQKYARMHELEEESVRLNTVNEQLTRNVDNQKREIQLLKDELNNTKKYLEDLKEENESLKIDLTTQASKFGPLQQLQQLDHPTYLKTLGTLTMNSYKSKLKTPKDLERELRDKNEYGDEEEDEEEELNKTEQIRSLNKEIEQLKIEKGEIAVHLEKVQAMLRIQIETAQQREKIYLVEKEAQELKYKALLEKAQELAEITDMKGFLQGEQKQELDLQNVQLHRKGNVDYTDNVSEFSDDEDTQIDESKGQNFFDMWVGTCSIYGQNLSKATQGRISEDDNILVFSTIDFYDHETQTTPVCEGKSCYFNFQCSYKVNTKGAFLHYLETGSIRIEVYSVYHQDAILIGQADVNLDFLFKNNKKDKISAVLNQSISLTHHGIVTGEISIKARVRRPISNQIRFYIESKNNELEKLEELEHKQKIAYEQNKPFDELEGYQDNTTKRILVIAIEKGQGFDPKSTTFVYYSIQGKDYYTRSIQGSQPIYDHHQKIEITNVSQFLNQISKIPLQFYVFDDLQPFSNEQQDNNDCLGVATVQLDGLNKNQIVDAVIPIKDEKKEKRGTIYAKIFWYEYQDNLEIQSRIGENLMAKQWEKEFVLKLAKALKQRHLNTSNGFMIFDRNNDSIIDQNEFVSSCLGTLNMTEFSRDEVIYFYEKQRQPFNRDAFEALLRPYLIEDKQRIQYLEEINLLQKNVNRKDEEDQQQAQLFNLQQMQKEQFIKNNIQMYDNSNQSLKEFLQKNTETLLDQSRIEAIREMVSDIIINEMRTRSAIDVFSEIDSDNNDEIDANEMQQWLLRYGLRATPDEIRKFLKTFDVNNNNTLDLIEFMKYVQKESNASRILYYEKYPKLERANVDDKFGSYNQSTVVSDDQIIHDIEEKIFKYMIDKKLKIFDLHHQIDKDKNNSLGRQELSTFFKNKFGIQLTRRDMDVVFQTFDKDKDGQISLKEFVEHLKNAINIRKSLKQLRSSQHQSNISPQKSAIRLGGDDDEFNRTTQSRFQKSIKFKQ
ncbi:EF hand protein (macronuclear) [Tetrahymena thermophila SB210]|uniref:EF hand protein n=1 Tax=Tetrahymena thermophila (strain SB210) TaxID=312017 RepID=I7LZG7_TETTS|nr:EF hand protein [Tetrahymena thermophila SB210]EAR83902.1 EF hand protein [Tetrahymena thermophila SB210]|eukprot:XP_001031565.1 EF hand protein [Tetrahymena thermophila SB210]